LPFKIKKVLAAFFSFRIFLHLNYLIILQMAKIPKEWHEYFGEVDPKRVDLEKNAYYVMGRVLEWGRSCGGAQATSLLRRCAAERVFIIHKLACFGKKTMRFWQVVLKLSSKECERIASIRKHRLWPY